MPLMNAVQVAGPGSGLVMVQTEIPGPGEREVLLKVEACGVCHGDAIPMHGRYPGFSYPRVPGREVVGVVAKRRHGSQRLGCRSPGRRRLERRPLHDLRGVRRRRLSELCGSPCHRPLGRRRLRRVHGRALVGLGEHPEGALVGGRPRRCSVRWRHHVQRPQAQRRGRRRHRGDPRHRRSRAPGTAVREPPRLPHRRPSRGPEKELLARELGAHAYIDTDATDAAAALQELGGARIILCTAPNVKAIAGLINGLGMDGQLIIVAGLTEPLSFNPASSSVAVAPSRAGTASGQPTPWSSACVSASMPMIETFPLERAADAFEKMMSATVRFRAVLTMDA